MVVVEYADDISALLIPDNYNNKINILTSKMILLGYQSIIRNGMTWNYLPLVN